MTEMYPPSLKDVPSCFFGSAIAPSASHERESRTLFQNVITIAVKSLRNTDAIYFLTSAELNISAIYCDVL